MRYSKQRDTVLSVVKEATDHPTADVIYSRVKKVIPDISLGTVYRNLGQLREEGMITVVESSDQKVHYEGNLTEHIHFLCKHCGMILDCFCASPVPEKLLESGVRVESAKTVYYGLCRECQTPSDNAVLKN